MESSTFFIEVDHAQEMKHHQAACGDMFISQKLHGGERVISVLADGLGSGIKASVLSHLTATMAVQYAAGDADIARAARTILESLPVCSQRRIAYSTFTIVDVDRRGETRIIEYDNPPFTLMRGNVPIGVPHQEINVPTEMGRDAIIRESRFQALPEDRIVICSDGITQAGIGQPKTPLGWGSEEAAAFVQGVLQQNATISARQLARSLVRKAMALDGNLAKDDITVGVIYLRKPREVLLLTGAPVNRSRDSLLASVAQAFVGRKVICGGTTASILARELNRKLIATVDVLDPHVPPGARLEGFDLVTEGAITLATTARHLEESNNPDTLVPNAATRLAGVLLESDIIHIFAGTKINEALQDPTLPLDLDIRRNILQRLKRVLTEKYLKEVRINYV